VLNHETFTDVAEEVSSIVGEQGLNLLINNAGVSPRSTRIKFVTAEAMAETFAVNTTSPLMLTKALLPLLKAGASVFDEESDFCIKNAAVVNISSVLGSISNNIGDHSGGLYPYRCSKVKFLSCYQYEFI
jgi:NAD(P)-dependent dehydrogenase (short-subunit alcohol dehydrogenase family)